MPAAWTASQWQVNAAGTAELRDFGDRLDDACLVVGEHDGHEPCFGADGLENGRRIDRAAAPDWNDGQGVPSPLQLVERLEHRGMLDGRCDNVMTSGGRNRPENRSVVRLRPAAREDDLSRGGSDQPCNGFTRILDDLASDLAFFMNARGISKDVPQSLIEN